MSARRVGVEEEFLLADPETGQLRAASAQLMQAHRAAVSEAGGLEPAGQLEQELYLQQIEIGTPPVESMTALAHELRIARTAVHRAADAVGALVVASGSPILEGGRHVTPNPRYQTMVDQFGEVARESVVCGMHVHVEVGDDEARVAALDYLRPWLPVLRAISVNSPYWHGRDTSYASWRAQVWSRWPVTGPAEPYRSLDGYRAATGQLLEARAALDKGMFYLDARLAERYPTIEIRVADVCTELDDVLLIAALSRALVEVSTWSDPPGPVAVARTDALRVAHWRASRYGVADRLVSPLTQHLDPARAVLRSTVDTVRDALDELGDTALVEDRVERLLARGSGATAQRSVFESTGDLKAVLEDVHRRFVGTFDGPS